MRMAGGLVVLAAMFAGPIATDAEAAKRTNYSSAATKVAKGISTARSDRAAKKQMLALFRHANVTVLGNGRRPKRLVRGFARGPRDFFLVDPQVTALAGLARAKTEPPVRRFSVALSELTGKTITPDQTAEALRLWITDGRKAARRRPRDARVFMPTVVDRLARARGVDLTKATADTKLSGIEMYLIEMTLTPARPAGGRAASAPAAAAPLGAAGGTLRAASICGELNSGSGFGVWLARGFAWALVRVVDGALPFGLTVRSLSQVAVGLGTSVRVAPGSETQAGRPIHWQHFDSPAPDPSRFQLLFTSDLPIPRALSECLEFAGIDVPPRGGTRSGVPVIWWLDDGTPTAPEIDEQTLWMQGRWQKEGPDSSISQIADLAPALPGGRLLGSSASDGGGVATMKFTPRREPGPYPGPSEHVKGDLTAIPLTSGVDSNIQRVASLFSGVVRNVTFKVDIEHHVKLGWRFQGPASSDYTIPCDDEGCPTRVHIEFSPVRCAPRPELSSTIDPLLSRAEPIGITGNWLTPPFGGGTRTHNPGGSVPWAPAFVVPDPGGSAGWGTVQGGTETGPEGSPNVFRRGPDSPSAGSVAVEFWDDNGGGAYEKKNEQAVEVVPMRQAAELPGGFTCHPKELLEELP